MSELIDKQAVPDVVDVLYNVAANAVTATASSISRNILQIVSENRLRVRVAYRIALAVGQKMYGVAYLRLHTRHDARTSIPLCNLVAESSPPSGGTSRSDVCASDVRIDWEHPSPLLVAGVIVENGGLGWETGIVIYNIGQVRTGRKVAFSSNDDSDGVADPFVRPLRELECIKGFYWEGEAMDPTPIGRINIEVGAKRYRTRERCIDLDLRRSGGRGHECDRFVTNS